MDVNLDIVLFNGIVSSHSFSLEQVVDIFIKGGANKFMNSSLWGIGFKII